MKFVLITLALLAAINVATCTLTRGSSSSISANSRYMQYLSGCKLSSEIERSKVTFIIKHLGPWVDREELRELFLRYGPLSRFAISPTQTVALVSYKNSAHAARAFESLALKKYKQYPLYLEYAPAEVDGQLIPEEEKPIPIVQDECTSEAAEGLSRTLFIKNVSFKTTDEAFESYFKNYEGLQKATLRRAKSLKGQLGLSLGHGFVEFKTPTLAVAALKKLIDADRVLDGHHLQVELARGTGKSVPKDKSKSAKQPQSGDQEITKKITVKNLPFNANSKDIRTLFEAFGKVVSVRLPQSSDGSSRGFCFVEMASIQDAKKVYANMSHTHLLGRRLILQPTEN